MGELGLRPGLVNDQFCQFPDSELARIACVDRTGEIVGGVHQSHNDLYQVIHIAERARLAAIAVEGNRFVLQGLHNKIRDHTAIVWMHVRPVCVEDTGYLDAEPMLAMVVEEQRLCATLALVVTRSRSPGIDAAPIGLRLGVDLRITIDLTGGCLEDLGLDAFGQAQHVDGAMDTGLRGLYRVKLVMNGRCRPGQVVDLVHLHVEGIGDIMTHELEMMVVEQRHYIVPCSSEKVVDTEDVVTLVQQPVAEVGAQKAGAAGYENTFSLEIWHS